MSNFRSLKILQVYLILEGNYKTDRPVAKYKGYGEFKVQIQGGSAILSDVRGPNFSFSSNMKGNDIALQTLFVPFPAKNFDKSV